MRYTSEGAPLTYGSVGARVLLKVSFSVATRWSWSSRSSSTTASPTSEEARGGSKYVCKHSALIRWSMPLGRDIMHHYLTESVQQDVPHSPSVR